MKSTTIFLIVFAAIVAASLTDAAGHQENANPSILLRRIFARAMIEQRQVRKPDMIDQIIIKFNETVEDLKKKVEEFMEQGGQMLGPMLKPIAQGALDSLMEKLPVDFRQFLKPYADMLLKYLFDEAMKAAEAYHPTPKPL